MSTLEGGRSVGRYRILDFLGAGAMGEVYLAEDPHIERKLAIKTVRLVGRPQEVDDRKKRLLREARAAGRLLHPNVVTLFDAGEAEGLLYLAFEFVEGTDLASRLEKGPLSLREVLRIVRQAADALHYAHGQGIVHRDIKPSNILLDPRGRVKVADFGIAKMAGQSTELTMAGSVMGSPQYLSPEQIRGEDLDGRSDIFSLGVVLYELLSGSRPFSGETITTLVYQILHKDPPRISDLRAVPPRLEALLGRMLAKDRDERLATAAEVAGELAAIETELSDETLAAPAGSDELARTFILPRRAGETTAPSLPPVPPPPPPAFAAPTAPLTQTPAAIPPPPPPPLPVTPAGTAPRSASGARVWIPIVAVLVLAAALAAAWGLWTMRKAGAPAEMQTAEAGRDAGAPRQTAEPAVPPPLPASAVPPPATKAEPSRPGVQERVSPPQTRSAPQPVPAPQEREPRVQAPPVEAPPPSRREPVPPPARESPRPAVPGPAVEPTPAPETPAADEEAAPSEPAPSASPRLPDADQTLRTGLEVAFRVAPQDAYVLVDGRVIGQAREWSGQKGARTYTFPGPGAYLVKIRKPGMKDYQIAVEAGAAGGVTPVAARLQPLPAAEVETTDLETVRVREAVAFQVRPPLAMVLVDGQVMGPARKFSGGLGRRGWLELPPGTHRVSVAAPGFRRKDLRVEVTAGAEKERERIELVLSPGGNE
ncbi:MAG TPA: protein kinase [Thermoanaerobaculia bacterium]|nr:protein kinase [Thermoanaerobaculia bacterium]